jgi:hypothetical protein
MDETGRNGRKWHLAQQTTYPVIVYILSKATINTTYNVTQFVIRYVLSSTTNPIPCNHDYHTNMGGFLLFL